MTNPLNIQRVQSTPEDTVIVAACAVFGDLALALTWLSQPNRALGGGSPMQQVQGSGNPAEILRLLGRIDQGVYS